MCRTYNKPLTERESFQEFDLPLDQRLSNFLEFLEEVIENYECLAGRMAADSAKRARLESKSAVVPEAHRLDRLLRYRASLERDYDRTLNRLLRLQQIRKGQPVPPTLK